MKEAVVIGLLGGIGSGKSTVAALFAEAGAQTVDADQLAHEALASPEVRSRVLSRFGEGVRGPDGQVDRRALADRVFGDPEALRELNSIVHPPVRAQIEERIRRHRSRDAVSRGALLVLDVPLLAESPLKDQCDALVFVEAAEEARRARLAARRWPPGEMERRESFQTPLEAKKRLARFTLNNSGSLEATRAEVARVLREIQGACRLPAEEEKGR